MLDGDTFGFLGFDFRRKLNREKNRHYILLTPKKKARKAIKQNLKIKTFVGTTYYDNSGCR